MCDMAISIVNQYIDEHLSVIATECSKDLFEYQSYARWAAYEIMERLNNEAERLPSHITGHWREPISSVDIIAGFIDEMECYIYDGCSKRHEHIFSIAKKVADEIILLFL